MTQILSSILTGILLYGYPVIFVMIVGSEIGLPLPTSTVLMASGAFSLNGGLNFFILLILATTTSVAGDLFGYYMGKKYGLYLIDNFLYRFGIEHKSISIMETYLSKWGGYLIFFTRWLLLPVSVPTNIVSGMTNYNIWKFLPIVVVGETLWAFIYLYLGYLFGASWIDLVNYVGSTPQIVTFGLIGFLILGYLYKIWNSNKKSYK